MNDVIEGLEDQADAFEEQLDQGQPKQLNAALANLRGTSIGLRRYLVPQLDALLRLAAAKVSWLPEDDLRVLSLRFPKKGVGAEWH